MKTRINRALLLFSFIVLIASNGSAKSRTSLEALGIANTFSQTFQPLLLRSASGNYTPTKLAYTCTNPVTTRSSNASAFYYIFNIGENNGFVIVSGDDRAKNILGYADNGSFSTDNLPENFRNWMSFYEKELKALATTPEDTTINISTLTNLRKTTSDAFATSISPLLGSTKWDQSAPYNIFCPTINSNKAPTGCVATAMAQVMKFHEWPVTGSGSKSYKSLEVTDSLSVDFSKTSYDWANMLNIYDGSSNTAIQDTAVATLMYHCGVAVSMDYSENSSGAYSNDIPAALSNHFGYDQNIQLYTRNYFSEAEWIQMIKTELNNNRPILYGGSDVDGSGHQFVCDGYDSNTLFHFNWGWSGYCNGYFELSSLNVQTPGIGGGTGGYSVGQDIVTGIQKPTETSIKTYQIHLLKSLTANKSTIARNSTFNINFGFANYGGNTFVGEIALGLYQGDSLVLKLNEIQDITLLTYWGESNYTTDPLAIPSTLADGSYQLYAIYKGSDQSTWSALRDKVGTPNVLNVTVTPSEIAFTTPDVYPKLTLTEPIKAIGNIYKGKTARFRATIQNTGGEYNSYLILQLKSPTNALISQNINYDPINIPAGSTKTIEITGNIYLAPGDYNLSLLQDLNNNQDNYSFALVTPGINNSVSVTVTDATGQAPVLILTEKMSLAESTLIKGSEAVLTAKIKNTGGYFNNNLVAFIFESTGHSSIDYIGPNSVILDTNEEKIVSFNKSLYLEDGSYFLALYYTNEANNGNWSAFTPNDFSRTSFTVDNLQTGIEKGNSVKPSLYSNPATNELSIQSTSLIKSILILDISGKQILNKEPLTSGIVYLGINNLSQGVYLIKIETENGLYTEKFFKK